MRISAELRAALRARRLDLGYSHPQVAEMMGLGVYGYNTISHYERIGTIHPARLVAWAAALGCEIRNGELVESATCDRQHDDARAHAARLVAEAGGSESKVARLLGITPTAARKLMKEWGCA